MRTTTEREFLRWAANKSLTLDPRYPDSAVLDYQGGSDARFWAIPPEPERRPNLIAALVQLLGDWQTCYVWRHLGRWPDPAHLDSQRASDVVESRILQGLGLPLGTSDVVAFDHTDFAASSPFSSRRPSSAGQSERICTWSQITPASSSKPIIMGSSTFPSGTLETSSTGSLRWRGMASTFQKSCQTRHSSGHHGCRSDR